ncbi:MAG: hypothetical protein HY235_01185 [Acidobacteria bacterium]|nr:hypothetical protein [Acidobacteriota bacterium]
MDAENAAGNEPVDIKGMIRHVIREYAETEREKAEPAYKAELVEERRRRETLERRVNELIEENRRSRASAEEAERSSTIRGELQRQGVTKLDLAYKALKEDIRRAEDGRFVVSRPEGEIGLREYVSQFVTENPEFLPARMTGGSGAASTQRSTTPAPPVAHIDLEKIRPGMDRAELERIRQEVIRVATQSL